MDQLEDSQQFSAARAEKASVPEAWSFNEREAPSRSQSSSGSRAMLRGGRAVSLLDGVIVIFGIPAGLL
jgi:hypothetical protein